jgi:hypothetical protein
LLVEPEGDFAEELVEYLHVSSDEDYVLNRRDNSTFLSMYNRFYARFLSEVRHH